MSKQAPVKILTALVALAILATPLFATTESISRAELSSRIASGGDLFDLVAMIGDGLEGSTSELTLSGGLGQSLTTSNFSWQCNREEAFSLKYSRGLLTFLLGDVRLETQLSSGPEALYIHAIAEPEKSGLTIIDLHIDGEHLGSSCWTLGPWGEKILWIDGDGLSSGFELTGTANFAWIGDFPGAQDLSFALGGIAGSASEDKSWSQVKQLY
jgi:hypothetical protein